MRRVFSLVFAVAGTALATVIAAGGCGLDVVGVLVSSEAGASTTSSSTSGGGDASSSTTTSAGGSSTTSTTSSTGGPVCPPDCGGCPGGVCAMGCTSTTCTDAMLTCPAGMPCRVSCSGTESCKGRTITCPPDAACDVKCTGAGTCAAGTKIMCGTGQPCTVTCSGNKTCEATRIVPSIKSCIRCEGTGQPGEDGCHDLGCNPAIGGVCQRSCIDQPCGGQHFNSCASCILVDACSPAVPD